MPVRVDFDALPWRSPAAGVRFKEFARQGQRLRLLEFSNGFAEQSWCTQGHAFRVLEGAFVLDTEQGRTCFGEGDVGFIDAGRRHKASVGDGERALLLLFEVGDLSGAPARTAPRS